MMGSLGHPATLQQLLNGDAAAGHEAASSIEGRGSLHDVKLRVGVPRRGFVRVEELLDLGDELRVELFDGCVFLFGCAVLRQLGVGDVVSDDHRHLWRERNRQAELSPEDGHAQAELAREVREPAVVSCEVLEEVRPAEHVART